MHVKKNDTVVILSGNDRGKRGRVLKVFPDKNRVIIEGVRFIKRHTRPNPKNQAGGILEKEAPINASNVMVICSKCGEPARTKHREVTEEGRTRHIRACVRCGEVF
ncbi:MAG: 50S ribosomal protein L24 [Candidatus Zixiibacteriota bacterium]|nr:MAG: 50S ribosomal protein L24 [candidate division Zixibacteria bacterium]